MVNKDHQLLQVSGLTFSRILRSNLRLAKDAIAFLSTHFVQTFLIWFLVGLALSLPTGLWLIKANLQRSSVDLNPEIGFTVYMASNATQSEIAEIADELANNELITRFELLDNETVLEEYLRLVHLPESLKTNAISTLPMSFEAVFTVNTSYEQGTDFASQLQSYAQVDTVVNDMRLRKRLANLKNLIDRAVIAIGLFFGLCVLFINFAAIRLAITSRLDEIEVLQLIGAAPIQISGTYVWCGLMYGAGGGLVAVTMFAGLIELLINPIANLMASYGLELPITGFDLKLTLIVILTGTLVSALGASISTMERMRYYRKVRRS